MTALKVGTAAICAESRNGEAQAFCIVRVLYPNPVIGVSLDNTQIEMVVGDESFLVANIIPSDATLKNVTWTSSDPEVANVVDGKVKALKEGQAIIIVETEDGKKKAECKVIVNNISVSLDKLSVVMYEGDGMLLNVNVFPSYVTGITFKWISSDETVVSVEDGFILAKYAGKAKVSVVSEDGKSEASCDVVILQKPVEYIDEFGVNHGYGILIKETYWAPVNCGYHVEDFPYGKHYQFGRKYGQGLGSDFYGNIYDNSTIIYVDDCVSLSEGQNPENSSKFYCGPSVFDVENWLEMTDDTLWNSGTESDPIKGKYDPCPNGWRVPTKTEWMTLASVQYHLWDDSINGAYFGYVKDESNRVFFSASGTRTGWSYGTGSMPKSVGESGNYWTSSPSIFYFDASNCGTTSNSSRWYGCSVRCVQE